LNYWFTSDWHLNHKHVMQVCSRPFETVEFMDDTIIYNLYHMTKPGDQVYFLGDLSFNRNVGLEFLKKIPRNIHFHFIWGNHDKKMWKKDELLKYCASVQWIKDIKINKQKITLCHYMMSSWNCSHWNAWHLFGHHHNKTQADHAIGKTMSVCVDLHNFFPVSFDQVKAYMETRHDNWDLVRMI